MNATISLKNLTCLCLCCLNLCAHTNKNSFLYLEKNNSKAFIQWIKDGGDCNLVDDSRESLLIKAVKLRNIRLLKFLLKQKGILVNYKDSSGKVALDYAVDLENINSDSPMMLQHLQYDLCTSLVSKNAGVTSVDGDVKLRAFLLRGKPKYDKTLLGFCVDNSSGLISSAAAYKMTFLGPFIGVVTTFLGSFVVYSVDRIAHYRRLKKYNRSFLL